MQAGRKGQRARLSWRGGSRRGAGGDQHGACVSTPVPWLKIPDGALQQPAHLYISALGNGVRRKPPPPLPPPLAHRLPISLHRSPGVGRAPTSPAAHAKVSASGCCIISHSAVTGRLRGVFPGYRFSAPHPSLAICDTSAHVPSLYVPVAKREAPHVSRPAMPPVDGFSPSGPPCLSLITEV